ncbi:MAG: MBOAT family protein [Oscillospiraceae bacterium]|nr:MBOAT family protein [Oscillospiraceae bacterium]
MVFSSLMFMCIFLPVMLIAYNISKSITYKNIILVIVSLFFYAWGEPVWVVLLIFSALVDYVNGRVIDKYYARAGATIALVSSLVINLGLLVVFKYSGFFTDNINLIFHTDIPKPGLELPIGISFYTFQTLSYTIDMYRGKTRVQKSFLSFLAYVSMFPQLVAGPIVRYSSVAAELTDRRVTAEDFAYGVRRFTAGLCKKVMLANSAGSAASMILDSTRLTVMSSWLGIIMYTFQIYFDFSGYSDMAIGLGRMLGFHFPENFEYPYISRNITEFWRRWHISLSSFFRDYVYIPLGGNRYRPIRNILIVWLLTGFWHGASWNFVLWGLFYALLLLAEKNLFRKKLLKIPAPLCYIYTMFFVILGWALFYFTDLGALWTFAKSAFGVNTALYDLTAVSAFCTNAWLFAMCAIASTPVPSVIYNHLCKKSNVFAAISQPLLVMLGLGACFVLLVGQTYNPFLYFRF